MEEPQSILETHPHLKDFFVFLDHLNQESDRGCVLVAATMIDDLLAKTLHSFFIKNKSATLLIEGFNAPLGTLSSRIEACFAMGLIDEKEYADANIVRKVRNEFAHAIEVTFGDNKLRNLCAKLNHAAIGYESVVVDTKGQFTTAATAIILNLTNRPHYVSKARLTTTAWAY